MLQQRQDAAHVFDREAGFCRNNFLVVAFVPQGLDAGQELQWSALAPSDVFGEAHDEGVLVADLDD